MRRLLALALSAAALGLSLAAWLAVSRDGVTEPPPPVPASSREAASAAPRHGATLVRIAALDRGRLGQEAREACAWLGLEAIASVREEGERAALVRGDGATRAMSPELARALRRVLQHAEAGERARARPATLEELRGAATSPEGVQAIARAFESALEGRVVLPGGRVLVPEIGGEAVLGDGLELLVIEDPTRELLRSVAAAAEDPDEVVRLLAAHPEEAALFDEHGQLASEVELWTARAARGMARERRLAGWRGAVSAVLESAADSFVLHPAAQLDLVVSRDWHGRLLGAWHLHPPSAGPAGLLPGDVPSPDDLEVARATGQFLTIVFRPDGFDLHDLSRVPREADDATGAPRIEHRSEAWRERFLRAYRETIATH